MCFHLWLVSHENTQVWGSVCVCVFVCVCVSVCATELHEASKELF